MLGAISSIVSSNWNWNNPQTNTCSKLLISELNSKQTKYSPRPALNYTVLRDSIILLNIIRYVESGDSFWLITDRGRGMTLDTVNPEGKNDTSQLTTYI